MQNMQRVLLVLAVAGVLWFGMFMMYQENYGKLKAQWEVLKTERFLKEICKKKECSYEELQMYYSALNYVDTMSEIRLEEYRKEWDWTGKIYYYLISWEELSESVINEGNYSFGEGSVIKISIIRRDRKASTKKQYFGIVAGKEGI